MLAIAEELKVNGETAIDSWKNDGVGEGPHFDCKLKTDPSTFKLSKEDRKTSAKR